MRGVLRGDAGAALVATAALAVAVALAQAVGGTAGPSRSTPASALVAERAAEPAQPVSFPAATAVPHGHHGEYVVQYEDLPPETRTELDVVRSIIERYPTAADATADGWRPATVNLKGIAAHFLRDGPLGFTNGIDERFDVRDPEILLFDGIEAEAPIVGVSYLVSGPGDPEGFSGPWDVWHRHDAVCFAGGLVIGEVGGHPDSMIDVSADECRAQGGITFPIGNLSMIHVWMKPGYPSETGVFGHDHSDLY